MWRIDRGFVSSALGRSKREAPARRRPRPRLKKAQREMLRAERASVKRIVRRFTNVASYRTRPGERTPANGERTTSPCPRLAQPASRVRCLLRRECKKFFLAKQAGICPSAAPGFVRDISPKAFLQRENAKLHCASCGPYAIMRRLKKRCSRMFLLRDPHKSPKQRQSGYGIKRAQTSWCVFLRRPGGKLCVPNNGKRSSERCAARSWIGFRWRS
jgi:hypothetical protein